MSVDYVFQIKGRIRRLRSAKRMTVAECARLVSKSPRTWEAWEALSNTTLPKTIELFAVCEVLSCDVNHLLGDSGGGDIRVLVQRLEKLTPAQRRALLDFISSVI